MLQGIAGFCCFTALAWAFSANRRAVPWRTVVVGLVLQVCTALFLVKFPVIQGVFSRLNGVVLALEKSTAAGTGFVFGYLGGGPLPFEETRPGASFILAFRALPLVLVISALSALLFYWNILPRIVRAFAVVLERTLGIGGAEGVGISANIFVGMVESPLLVRPYLSSMTRSEIFSLMTCGMATIAGTVMVLYASILGETIPNVLGHILTASMISAPAAVMIAKIMVPETREKTSGKLKAPAGAESAMDAVATGTRQGVELLINIVAMIVVLVALVSLANMILALLPDVAGRPLTLERIAGTVMAPVTWLMGVPWSEAHAAGSLMGTKTILNEFLAYLQMAELPAGVLSPHSRIIMLYALCGFANPGSLGIMIAGMGSMAPERRGEITALGIRSLIAGTLATSMTGAVIGCIV